MDKYTKHSFFTAEVQASLYSTPSEAIFTRDDVVSHRLKFGSAFLSFSWESKIALFF